MKNPTQLLLGLAFIASINASAQTPRSSFVRYLHGLSRC